MPGLGDTAFIFFLALLLFGPKKLPELARQLGKLMAEFRRASNEFKMQMEEELRVAEQAEQQKKIAAMEAAAPTPPALPEASVTENTIAAPAETLSIDTPSEAQSNDQQPLPIATSGELKMMPPSTGLPVASSSPVASAFDSVPQVTDPDLPHTASAVPAFDPSEGHTPDAPDHSPSEAPIHG
jgi:sec-independent protein translocase protein TatB